MGALKNPRWELFAMCMALGELKASRAYEKAYGKKANPNVNEANACRLLKNAQVEQRIAELRAKATEETEWTIREKVDFLRKMAVAPVESEEFGVIRPGDRVKSLELGAKLQCQLKSVEVTENHLHIGEVDNLLLYLRSGGQQGSLGHSEKALDSEISADLGLRGKYPVIPVQTETLTDEPSPDWQSIADTL